MHISDFSLHDFRSYSELVLRFEPGVNVLVGRNGQGKTNIVEGIEYLSTHSSHRVSSDTALVRQGAAAAVVRARVNSGSSDAAVVEQREEGDAGKQPQLSARSTLLEIEILAGRANRARLNRGAVKPAETLGIVRTIVFAPEDLSLVTGDPSVRRRFLDVLMIQEHPRMKAVKSDYEKVLRQRAALLKEAAMARRRGRSFDEATLDVFDSTLAALAEQIVRARADIVARLAPHVAHYYREVSGEDVQASVHYAANTLAEDFPGALAKMRRREIEAGQNLVGPHRDDVQLQLGSLPAKGYASHGESWSFALALRLASWQVLRSPEWGAWSEAGEPILILDDVFAELDARRRARLVDLVREAEQVFVTAAVGDDLPENLAARRYLVANGEVTVDES